MNTHLHLETTLGTSDTKFDKTGQQINGPVLSGLCRSRRNVFPTRIWGLAELAHQVTSVAGSITVKRPFDTKRAKIPILRDKIAGMSRSIFNGTMGLT